MDLTKIDTKFLENWRRAAEFLGIPQKSYSLPRLKVLADPSGKSNYTFLAYSSPSRERRNQISYSSCALCGALRNAQENPILNLGEFSDYLVYPNLFPLAAGISIGLLKRHLPIYENLNSSSLEANLEFAEKSRLKIYHNDLGFGASIPYHEHFHFLNFSSFFEAEGMHGFEGAELEERSGLKIMPEFPFSHVIIDELEPGRIIEMICRLHKRFGMNFPSGKVPYCLIQGEEGILLVPEKNLGSPGRGATDMAGIWVTRNDSELESLTYGDCIDYLSTHLFKRTELDLSIL